MPAHHSSARCSIVTLLLLAELGGNSVMVRMISDLFDERHGPITWR